jgi:hypothetical protein
LAPGLPLPPVKVLLPEPLALQKGELADYLHLGGQQRQ